VQRQSKYIFQDYLKYQIVKPVKEKHTCEMYLVLMAEYAGHLITK